MISKTLKIVGMLGVIAAAGIAVGASAQNAAVSQALAQGIVGETSSGYLGFAQTPSPEVRDQVDAINIQRRARYTQIAEQRGVQPQVVAHETACSVFGRLESGRVYQLDDGVWRTKGSAPVSC